MGALKEGQASLRQRLTLLLRDRPWPGRRQAGNNLNCGWEINLGSASGASSPGCVPGTTPSLHRERRPRQTPGPVFNATWRRSLVLQR